MDERGRLYFIECNPLPGLTPGWSDLVLISQASGLDYRALIGEILSGAIRRYKEREAKKAGNGVPAAAAAVKPAVAVVEEKPAAASPLSAEPRPEAKA
jgi:D-alanine-D-alanine ligase